MTTADSTASLMDLVFQTIAKSSESLSREFLLQELQCDGDDLETALVQLRREGRVMRTLTHEFTEPYRIGFVVGRVIGHRDGFGFLKLGIGEDDLFLAARQMRRAMHGDLVLAAPTQMDAKGRREAKIIKVLQPGQSQIVGRFFAEGTRGFVSPDDPRLAMDIMVDLQGRKGARQGQFVVVELIDGPKAGNSPTGKIIEVLGETMAPGMEVQLALRNHDIPHQWPNAVTKAVKSLSEEVEDADKEGRVDLRKLPLITIDGEDARDFDDAVYCEPKKGGGWRLWVAIADVSYYVRPGTALDDEAYVRATSVYFPDQVIPMLPEKLSNGLCSLNPLVDRLCMVCEMTISAAGRLSGYKFYQAVMHSHARLTYNKVAAILDGDDILSERYVDQVQHLHHLHDLYGALKVGRLERGGIELETQETRFIFNAQRKIEQIVPTTRNDAHKIIEECMIQANVSAARFVEKNKKEILFRVHESPSDDRLSNFRGFLAELGLKLEGGDEPEPKHYAAIAREVEKRPDRELIQTMLLRSMKQAVYQPDNMGHFGLALKSYAHFTSPIRRYPDLLLHRVIKFLIHNPELEAGETKAKPRYLDGAMAYSGEDMQVHGEHCSMAERRADDATREVSDRLKCEFMLDHVGMTYDGNIATVTAFGMFIRLSELHIEGLVHISSLRGDYFHYDAARQTLTGENTGKRFRIGDKVQVKVLSVNMDDRRLEFGLEGDDFASGPRNNKGGKSSKSQRRADAGKKTAEKRQRRSAKANVAKAPVLGPNGELEKPAKERLRDKKNKGKPKSKASKAAKASAKAALDAVNPWAKTKKKPKVTSASKKKRKARAGKNERNAAKDDNKKDANQ
ncbi:ribonuclease R [Alginatibacterium sediminis]|uniref:Ribonuclease R n=1 Tax=Alginatibacterium sediminis TaxID=2164068 RepID=A0A420E9K4_9ALTE|nr:ribonuclease R [Alginatibacterium sediminis]RKF15802.1 ribonuclease R [Alginatibacterium sediminis]